MNIHIAITHLRSKLLQMHLNFPFELLTVHIWILFPAFEGFPGSSVGKESACNAGDPSSIPGLGRSIGEGIGYPLQDSLWQVIHPWETWVQSLGWEDPLEKGMATHSSILAWRIPWTVYIVYGIPKSRTGLSNFHFPSKNLADQIFIWLSWIKLGWTVPSAGHR